MQSQFIAFFCAYFFHPPQIFSSAIVVWVDSIIHLFVHLDCPGSQSDGRLNAQWTPCKANCYRATWFVLLFNVASLSIDHGTKEMMIRIEGDRYKNSWQYIPSIHPTMHIHTFWAHTHAHTTYVCAANEIDSKHVHSNIKRGKTLTAQELCFWIWIQAERAGQAGRRAIGLSFTVWHFTFAQTHTHKHTIEQNTVFDTKLQNKNENENEREFKRMVSTQHIKTLRIE